MSYKFDLSKMGMMDALDLAIIIEDDAKERYLEFYRQLGSNGLDDAGTFFLQMSKNEQKHTDDLMAMRKKYFKDAKAVVNRSTLYEFQEIEAPEFDRAFGFMSISNALKVAYDSEVKAHQFYHKASQLVLNDEVKKFFSELALEEIEHQKMVRAIMEKTKDEGPYTRSDDDIDEPNGL